MSLKPLLPIRDAACCSGSGANGGCAPTKFHLAVNVSDLSRAVRFYAALFNLAPAKQHADYAKFEVERPPVIFSLVPQNAGTGGSLTDLRLPVASRVEFEDTLRRVRAAGAEVTELDANRAMIRDFDSARWHLFVTGTEPLEVQHPALPTHEPEPPRSWEHRVMQPFSGTIPLPDRSVAEVKLEGTFNSALTFVERTRLLAEVQRILKPGGRVHVHGLVANLPISELPQLPGVAALVKQVPEEREPIGELEFAGFVKIRITKLSAQPVFLFGEFEFREMKLIAHAPSLATVHDAATCEVIYTGPFLQIVTHRRQIFTRGERVRIPVAIADELRNSPLAACFEFPISQSSADAQGDKP